MHSRMNEWVTLSPQQRAQARLNFARTKELSKQLTPEEKKAKWETYQALSPEEKQKLAAKANPKPAGAATAVKPVAPQKLAPVPPHPVKAASKPAPKITPSQPVSRRFRSLACKRRRRRSGRHATALKRRRHAAGPDLLARSCRSSPASEHS
jgi:hypothetical protein